MILLVAVFAVGVVVGMAAGLLLAMVWLTETNVNEETVRHATRAKP